MRIRLSLTAIFIIISAFSTAAFAAENDGPQDPLLHYYSMLKINDKCQILSSEEVANAQKHVKAQEALYNLAYYDAQNPAKSKKAEDLKKLVDSNTNLFGKIDCNTIGPTVMQIYSTLTR